MLCTKIILEIMIIFKINIHFFYFSFHLSSIMALCPLFIIPFPYSLSASSYSYLNGWNHGYLSEDTSDCLHAYVSSSVSIPNSSIIPSSVWKLPRGMYYKDKLKSFRKNNKKQKNWIHMYVIFECDWRLMININTHSSTFSYLHINSCSAQEILWFRIPQKLN